jgi:hypothetical protein
VTHRAGAAEWVIEPHDFQGSKELLRYCSMQCTYYRLLTQAVAVVCTLCGRLYDSASTARLHTRLGSADFHIWDRRGVVHNDITNVSSSGGLVRFHMLVKTNTSLQDYDLRAYRLGPETRSLATGRCKSIVELLSR